MRIVYALILCVTYCFPSIAQTTAQDSLRKIMANENLPDTVRLAAKSDLTSSYRFSNSDTVKILAEALIEESSKIHYISGLRSAYGELFIYYYIKGDLDSAQVANFKLLQILQAEYGESHPDVASVYNYIGMVYRSQGDYSRALSYHLKSTKIAEAQPDNERKQSLLSTVYNNIGIIYNEQREYRKSLEYYFKRLKVDELLADTLSVADCYNNIGFTYYHLKEYETSLNYHLKGLNLHKSSNNRKDMCYAYINIAELYAAQNQPEKGLSYVQQGLPLAIEFNNKQMTMRGYAVLGWCQRLVKKFPSAIENGNKAVTLSDGFRIIEQAFVLEQLYKTYEAAGQMNLAYQAIKAYYTLQDSIINDDNRKKTLALEANSAFEKEKQLLELEKVKERVAFEASLEQERLFRYGMFGGIFMLVALLFLAFRAYRIKQKAHHKSQLLNDEISKKHHEVSEQKELIEKVHRDITDSINYAKRIQGAILPPQTVIQEHLPNSFILFKPKNVVSGDFYWITKAQDQVLFAVADCTGHGVPGAMVSVVCNNALNRSVREYGLVEPAQILDKTREIILAEFETVEGNVTDGMDISLCALNNHQLLFAGAYNPLWVVRNQELIEVKGDRQPIGQFKKTSPFTTHQISLQPNDMIYLFSDGFADQFGGDANQKFKKKQFRETLIQLHQAPLHTQKEQLEQLFETWKGDYKQIDDVCILGVRIS